AAARRRFNSTRAAASSLRNLATSSSSQVWVAINSARHSRTASAYPMRNAPRVSGRIAGTLSGQANHFGLDPLEEGEQRVHLPLQLGDRIELALQVSDLGLEQGDRRGAFLAPLFA